MTTPPLHPDFSAFIVSLTRHRVRFVVVGAHALAALGQARMTDDLDVLVEYLLPMHAEAREVLGAKYGHRPATPVTVEVFHTWADFSVRTIGFRGFSGLLLRGSLRSHGRLRYCFRNHHGLRYRACRVGFGCLGCRLCLRGF